MTEIDEETMEAVAHLIDEMGHALAMDQRPRKDKYVHYAYRDYIVCDRNSPNEDWEQLVKMGFAVSYPAFQKVIVYKVTDKGIEFMEKVTGFHITKEEEVPLLTSSNSSTH